MKLSYHLYTLHPQTSLSALAGARERRGALLKAESATGVGYADLHPWPELGDEPLSRHLEQWSKGVTTSLMKHSLSLAERDARWRRDQVSPMATAKSVKHHFLINDPAGFKVESSSTKAALAKIRDSGYEALKIKMNRELSLGFLKLAAAEGFRLRLDFNAKGDVALLQQLRDSLDSTTLSRIELIEDPCPYSVSDWQKISADFVLAMDNEFEKRGDGVPAFQVLVIKPARQDVEEAVEYARRWNLKMVITSSLDHPVGVAHALIVASELKSKFPDMVLDSGCDSLRAYRTDEFAQAFGADDVGVGFTSLLERIPWQNIEDLTDSLPMPSKEWH